MENVLVPYMTSWAHAENTSSTPTVVLSAISASTVRARGGGEPQETQDVCGIRTLHLETKKTKYVIKKINKGTHQTRPTRQGRKGKQAERCLMRGAGSPLSSLLGTALSHARRAPLCSLPCAESSFTNSEPPSPWTRHPSHSDTWLSSSLRTLSGTGAGFQHAGETATYEGRIVLGSMSTHLDILRSPESHIFDFYFILNFLNCMYMWFFFNFSFMCI